MQDLREEEEEEGRPLHAAKSAHVCVCVGSRPAGRGGGWDDHADDDDIPVDRISRNPVLIAESEAR